MVFTLKTSYVTKIKEKKNGKQKKIQIWQKVVLVLKTFNINVTPPHPAFTTAKFLLNIFKTEMHSDL